MALWFFCHNRVWRPWWKNKSHFFLAWLFNLKNSFIISLWWNLVTLVLAVLYGKKFLGNYEFDYWQSIDNSCTFRYFQPIMKILLVAVKPRTFKWNSFPSVKRPSFLLWWKRWSQQLRWRETWSIGICQNETSFLLFLYYQHSDAGIKIQHFSLE